MHRASLQLVCSSGSTRSTHKPHDIMDEVVPLPLVQSELSDRQLGTIGESKDNPKYASVVQNAAAYYQFLVTNGKPSIFQPSQLKKIE